MGLTGTDIEAAAACLERGELVGIPTETVYGLAANALNEKAVAGIFEAKNRPHFDPLIVHISGMDQVPAYARVFPETARKLAEALWPGPLTLILPKQTNIPDLVTSGQDTVGLRVPAHPLTRALLSRLDFPLAAPSANPFGYVSPTTAAHVNAQLGHKVCYVLDGGPCEVGVESTIVGFEGESPVILRLGGIPVEIIAAIAGPVKESISAGSNPQAPGQLDSHYSPGCSLVIGADPSLLANMKGPVALIRFSEVMEGFPAEHQFILTPSGKLEEAAARLFGTLRLLDERGYQSALAEPAPETGLGRAINDRLRRAAAR